MPCRLPRSLLASSKWVCSPMVRPPACTSADSSSLFVLFGLTSRPTAEALGTSSRNNCRRFAPNGPASIVTPVALRPGRLRLATRPDLTGSEAVRKTIGMLLVAPLAIRAATSPPAEKIALTWTADQIDHQLRQTLEMPVRPPIFDRHVLAVCESHFRQPFAKCAGTAGWSSLRLMPTNPIKGIACRWACAPCGHAAAALPRSTINLRRCMAAPSSHPIGSNEHPIGPRPPLLPQHEFGGCPRRVKPGNAPSEQMLPLFTQERTQVGHRWMSVSCQYRKSALIQSPRRRGQAAVGSASNLVKKGRLPRNQVWVQEKPA